MNELNKIKSAFEQFNIALDKGDIDALAATCDPDVVICNEHQPTTVGVQALRDKYGPRMEVADFKSKTDITDIKMFGDFAIVVANFDVQTINKTTQEQGGGKGRVVIGYRRDAQGNWKMALDVDNND
ncbi:hypothetical protein FX988_04180 [Paraglaciecola mesophila]|uniref:DUF4440 domain-containing protein n=1 Tax=Paraglaciecola mesophila TaxID=197222 RepID=A0A857JPA1_9ALTE|nr:nuclear transport factor 2 family protein [Paraglaciecola mesophila]QHJ13899.1 hypothetical protein FX988_04180 [Paraglaciecola mesophila]